MTDVFVLKFTKELNPDEREYAIRMIKFIQSVIEFDRVEEGNKMLAYSCKAMMINSICEGFA